MKKETRKKLSFLYDDKKVYSCIYFLIFIIALAILFTLIKTKADSYATILLLIIIVLALFGGIFILFIDIHCNFEKRIITLVGSDFVRKIELDNIAYITLQQANKQRKKSTFPLFKEKVWYLDTEYVYNNGEVFVVEFRLKNHETIKMSYTWLFGTKNKNRVEKQKNKLEAFVLQMNKAIKEKQN